MAENAKFDFDPYDVLNVIEESSQVEITKAFRKAALKWHPDKNPDRIKLAQKMFVKISRAFEILSDPAVKGAYNNLRKARKANREKLANYDEKRRKFREELEAREAGQINRQKMEEEAARNLQKEIERLRNEGSKLLEKERENVENEVCKASVSDSFPDNSHITVRLRLKWRAAKNDPENAGYNHSIIEGIFSKYGHVSAVVISSKKNGSAIVEFCHENDAETALNLEKGLPEAPLSFERLKRPAQTVGTTVTSTVQQSRSTVDLDSFEAHVLANMKLAQHSRDLTENSQVQ